MKFLDCGFESLGIYPLVDRAVKLRPLIEAGISTVQLRIKDLNGEALKTEIFKATHLSAAAGLRLFINDYWQLAIEAGSYGVHLGQEDLQDANLEAIHRAGLRLGVSTHNPEEIDIALDIQPSYIAIGPVFETHSKQVNYDTTGLENLHNWSEKLDAPVVAIGGIDYTNIEQVVKSGANGIAMISGIKIPGLSDFDSLKKLQTQFNQAYES